MSASIWKDLCRVGVAMLLSQSVSSWAASCTLSSTPGRVTLLELYTSEGCSSCPPADRWVSALQTRGVTSRNVVTLAFHVDYWNDLGWPDRFSQARFSERQHSVATRAGAGMIYTPQLLLDGKDFRATSELRAQLAAINREAGRAIVQARIDVERGDLHISGDVTVAEPRDRANAEVWIAAFENGLSSQVQRGENAGRALHHDFVVRELVGPITVGSDGRLRVDRHLRIGSDWNLQQVGIALFAQRRDDGTVLQATAAPAVCGS